LCADGPTSPKRPELMMRKLRKYKPVSAQSYDSLFVNASFFFGYCK